MAIKKIKLPNNTEQEINDARLPDVTSSDNGNVLAVLGGSWAKRGLKTINNTSIVGTGNINIAASPFVRGTNEAIYNSNNTWDGGISTRALLLNKEAAAEGIDSISVGYGTYSGGRGSFSSGYCTRATGNYSHTEGYGGMGKSDNNDAVYCYFTSVDSNYKITPEDIADYSDIYDYFQGTTGDIIFIYSTSYDSPDQVLGWQRLLRVRIESWNDLEHNIVVSDVDGSPYLQDLEYNGECYLLATLGIDSLPDTLTASGNYSHAEGYKTIASGSSSHAEGNTTTANGQSAHAEGYKTETGGTATSNTKTAGSDTSSGSYAHAEGNATIAKGRNSHAEGLRTFSEGMASHAEGSNTKATELASHAEGETTTASGSYSHAEGYRTTSSGDSSHAEGDQTVAGGDGSHAEGRGSSTVTRASYSHAEGQYTQTTNIAEHAEGKYNLSTINTTLHSVGIGTSSARKNAHEITLDGKHYVLGVGGYDGTNVTTSGVQDLATVINSSSGSNGLVIHEVSDSGSTTAGTWKASNSEITALTDGLTIRYKLVVAGAATTTLNLNNLGAKTVYRFNTTKLTTHYAVGSYIILTYNSSLNSGCWITVDGYDSNSDNYVRQYVTSENHEYSILSRYNTDTVTSYQANYARFADGVTVNPSTDTITASGFKITGGTSSQVLTANGSTRSITISSSEPTSGTGSDGDIWIVI